ncbi:HNH endonuclease signature motif containing protein [Kineococcus radiotolerans]|uniref:HNH nuclease domain-containing protein n=1 Tax=Kineococcus radiotolerans (strain ATCC BAA-149 / DSM 14245 / SRS30216) TaxID=266940 RepID=A6W8V6_KINRD|nr:hypothetical protein Krad_1759 [Kineococcus radiotolerans SRS30216 = ATCC BAA-149]
MDWQERFRSAHAAEDAAGCLIWLRARNNRGYGVFWLEGRLRLAHRVAWYQATGRWPQSGLVLDHLCDVKACVNHEHLVEVTNRHNVLRSPASPMNTRRARTACGRGHTYTPESLRIDPRGHRQCRVCDRLRSTGGPLDLV